MGAVSIHICLNVLSKKGTHARDRHERHTVRRLNSNPSCAFRDALQPLLPVLSSPCLGDSVIMNLRSSFTANYPAPEEFEGNERGPVVLPERQCCKGSIPRQHCLVRRYLHSALFERVSRSAPPRLPTRGQHKITAPIGRSFVPKLLSKVVSEFRVGPRSFRLTHLHSHQVVQCSSHHAIVTCIHARGGRR